MKQRRAVFALTVLVGCASSMMLFAQSKDDKKKDEAQKREIQSIVKSVDDLTAGQPAANDLSMTWLREDVLKAQGNKEYVPFTVTAPLRDSKVPESTVRSKVGVVGTSIAMSSVPPPPVSLKSNASTK